MKTTRARLTPIPRRPENAPPPPPELYSEPTEELLILGEMLYDLELQQDLCRQLPFDRDHYQGNLRIIAGCATRIRGRCEKLLGEAPQPAAIYVETPTGPGAHDDAIHARNLAAVDREQPGAAAFSAAAGADIVSEEGGIRRYSNGDYAHVETLQDTEGEQTTREDAPAPAPAPAITEPSQLIRKNGAGHPKKTNGKPTKALIIGETARGIRELLKQQAELSTTEIIEQLRQFPSEDVHDALAQMRVAGEVITKRNAGHIVNYLASAL